MCEPRGSKANSRRRRQQRSGESPSQGLSNPPQARRVSLLAVVVVLTAAFAFAQSPACPPNTADYPCLYVANENLTIVSVISANTNRLIGTINLQKRLPQAVALSPDNAILYAVTSGSGPFEVSVIDTATGSVTGSFQGLVGDESPVQIAVNPDGNSVYVVIHGSDEPAVNRIDVT